MKEKFYKINGQKLNKHDTMLYIDKGLKEMIYLCQFYHDRYNEIQYKIEPLVKYVSEKKRKEDDYLFDIVAKASEREFAKLKEAKEEILANRDFDKFVDDVGDTIAGQQDFINTAERNIFDAETGAGPYFHHKNVELFSKQMLQFKEIYEKQLKFNTEELAKENAEKAQDDDIELN